MDGSISKPKATKAKSTKAKAKLGKTQSKSKFKQTPMVRKGPKTAKVTRLISAFKTRKVSQSVKKTQRAIHEYSEIGLQDFAILLFGEDAVREVKKKMDVREIWNISTNTTQCNNVIGRSTPETECWICGLKIDDIPGMKPECEHILPVAQAVIYLSLYSSKKPPKTDAERMVLQMEYGWAHTVCNQDKSDICCIINSGQNAVVSDKNIRYILNKIYTSNREDSTILKEKLKGLYPTLASFLAARLEAVKERYKRIVDFLNPTSSESRFKLTILAGLVTAMDYTNIHDEAQSLLSDEFLAQRESEKNMLKELLTDKVKQDIFEKIGYLDLETLAQAATILESVQTLFETQKAYYLKEYNLNDIVDSVTQEWEKNMFSSENPGISSLVKIYPQLYTRLALMFIDPATKSYKKAKIESDSILCLGFYLVLTYFTMLKKNMIINNKIRVTAKGKTIDKIEKIITTIEKYAQKNYPGIYEFIEGSRVQNSNQSMV
jgi:hypothetical protein